MKPLKPLKPLKALLNLVIKNSEVIQPFVSPKSYAKGLLVLNGVYLAMCLLDKDHANDNANKDEQNHEIPTNL